MIAVDWVYGSTGMYFSAVENVVKLSLEISRFLSKLLVCLGRFRLGLAICTDRKGQPEVKKILPLRFGAKAEPDSWGADGQST